MTIAGVRFPIWLILLYIVALLALLAWPFIAFTSAFMFDAPGSNNPSTWTLVGVMDCYPVLPVIGVPLSYLLYRKAKKIPAYVLAAIGAIPALMLGLLLLLALITSLVAGVGGGLRSTPG